jgi:outer membrane protein TolC
MDCPARIAMDERAITLLEITRRPLSSLSVAVVASIALFVGGTRPASAQSTMPGPSTLPAMRFSSGLPTGGFNGQPPSEPEVLASMPRSQFTGGAPLPPAADARAMQPAYAPPTSSVGPQMPPPEMPQFSSEAANYGRRTLPAGTVAPQLKPAPLEPADLALPINLATALRLADARPLMIAAAQASAWVAEAQLQRAQVLKVPELDLGVVYVRHDGLGPDFNHGVSNQTFVPGQGGILSQNLNWMYGGGGLNLIVPSTDAIFQPLSARQVLNSKRFDIQAAKNDALLAIAFAYFGVHQYRGQYAGAIEVVDRGEQLTTRIAQLSADLVPKVEVDRALSMLANVQQHAALARQQWRVASANLTQLLRLDPRVIVNPLEPDHLQITLIDLDRPLDELMPIALATRPELSSQQALIQAASISIRREKCRPLLPTVLLTGFQNPGGMTMQGMVFGLGQGNKMNLWSLREDVSAQLVWQLDGMGFGNMARIKKQRGMESQAIVDLFRMQDVIAAEVTQSQADLQSAAVRVSEAERSLREAIITYDGNYRGLAQTQRFENLLIQVYRPQEAVKALENLLVSYDNYFATVADYNRAQFELFHSLGYPAREVTALRPPGQVISVDTSRPAFLPAVGVGPPPATR